MVGILLFMTWIINVPRPCHCGVEFQGWLLNNTEHCFSYDKSTRIITYHGGSKIYVEFKSGEYDYDTFNQMIQATRF